MTMADLFKATDDVLNESNDTWVRDGAIKRLATALARTGQLSWRGRNWYSHEGTIYREQNLGEVAIGKVTMDWRSVHTLSPDAATVPVPDLT